MTGGASALEIIYIKRKPKSVQNKGRAYGSFGD